MEDRLMDCRTERGARIKRGHGRSVGVGEWGEARPPTPTRIELRRSEGRLMDTMEITAPGQDTILRVCEWGRRTKDRHRQPTAGSRRRSTAFRTPSSSPSASSGDLPSSQPLPDWNQNAICHGVMSSGRRFSTCLTTGSGWPSAN